MIAPAERLTRVKTRFVLNRDPRKVFFAALALRLTYVESTVPTMATDGRRILYSAAFVESLTDAELEGVLAHEVLHVAFAHQARCRADTSAEKWRWNVAADLAINAVLSDGGFTLPACALFPGQGAFAHLLPGLSAEEYYAILAAPCEPEPTPNTRADPFGKEQSKPDKSEARADTDKEPSIGEPESDNGTPNIGEPESDNGTPNIDPAKPESAEDPGGCGTFMPPEVESECEQIAAEVRVAVAEAIQIAARAGRLPGGLRNLLDNVTKAKPDWRDTLRRFLQSSAKEEVSWSRRNRRSVGTGLITPGRYSTGLGHVAICVDTSGSIPEAQLNAFLVEAEAILSAYDCRATILWHHASVYAISEWTAGDGPIERVKIESGGTSHVPVFAAIANLTDPVLLAVGLTDLFSEFPSLTPDLPVLWVTPLFCGKAPWGETVGMLA